MGDAYSDMTKLAEEAKRQTQNKPLIPAHLLDRAASIRALKEKENDLAVSALDKVEYCRLADLVEMLGADKPVRIEHFVAPTIRVMDHIEVDGTVSFILRVDTNEYNTLMGMHEPEFAIADLDNVDAALAEVDTDG